MLTDAQIKDIKDRLAKRESVGSGGYYALYPSGATLSNATAIGKYQFTIPTLELIARRLNQATPSRSDFYSNGFLQEYYMNELIKANYEYLISSGLINYVGKPVKSTSTGETAIITVEGLLAGMHLGGANGIKNLLTSNIDAKDANGTYVSDYVVGLSQQNATNLANFSIPVIIILIGIAIGLSNEH